MSNKPDYNQLIKSIKNLFQSNKDYFLHEPYFVGNEKKYLDNCINENFVSSAGNFLDLFHHQLKNYTQSKYCVLLNSGTSALHLSLLALGIRSEDEVLLPSLNFIASSNAILYCNAKPHYVDSDINDLGIDTQKLEKYLKRITFLKNNQCYNKKTKKRIFALIAMHTFGHIGNILEIKRICKKYYIKLIEDAAEALGSFYNNKHAGTFGDIGVISFNGNKIVTAGNGGAVLLNNKKLANKIYSLANTGKIKHEFEFFHKELSYNYRLSNINAAIGLAQLEKIKIILLQKKLLNQTYKNSINKVQGANIFQEKYPCDSNYWFQVLILDDSLISQKNKIIKNLIKKRIHCRPLWKLMDKNKYLKNSQKMNLDNAKYLYDRIICLPSSKSAYGK